MGRATCPFVKVSDIRYLVDAGPLIGWFNRRDQWHDWSVATLRAADDRLWTSESVFAEACYQLGQNTPEVAGLIELVEGGQLEVLPTVRANAAALKALLAKYPTMDLCDASLVILSEQYPRAKLITLDVRDFSIYRRFKTEPLALIMPPPGRG